MPELCVGFPALLEAISALPVCMLYVHLTSNTQLVRFVPLLEATLV